MSTMRCLVDPNTCYWSYTHDRQVIVDAAWREHYAHHAEGEAALRRYAELGTVHPQAPLPMRAHPST